MQLLARQAVHGFILLTIVIFDGLGNPALHSQAGVWAAK
jgi:hypothetical protein